MPLSDTRASSIDCRSGVGGRPAETTDGHVAEWLRSGLQNRLPRFNSGRGLQPSLAQRVKVARTAARYGWRASAATFKAGPALIYAAPAREQAFSPVAQR